MEKHFSTMNRRGRLWKGIFRGQTILNVILA